MIRYALMDAYDENDPEEERLGFRRSPASCAVGTEETLREELADLEEALKKNPKDRHTRKERLFVLTGLAQLAKLEDER